MEEFRGSDYIDRFMVPALLHDPEGTLVHLYVRRRWDENSKYETGLWDWFKLEV